MVWIRILEQKKTGDEPISILVSFAFVCLFCTALIAAFSSHLFHSLLWIVLIHVCAGCGTNTHTLHIWVTAGRPGSIQALLSMPLPWCHAELG